MLSAVTIFKERKVCKLISLALILRQVLCGCSKTLDPPPPVHIKAQSLGLVPWANVNHGGGEDTT